MKEGMDMRRIKVGDVVPVPDEMNERNRRNGLPYFRAQEVTAILGPGERGIDHGQRGVITGYLNAAEPRIMLNNAVASQLDPGRFFWPLKHPE